MKKKYELGVAFSGGGCKAAAHCGALQAMKEFGIKPDVVAGTSAGSLVASFWSAGFSPVQMIEMFRKMSFFKDIVSVSKPRGGLFDPSPLLEIIQSRMPYTDIEQLPVPTYIVASDMDNGKVKVFTKGKIAPRLVASCSIPIVFKPTIINGIHYVDGGVFQNLPVPAIRSICEKVLAFSVRRMEPETYKDNLLYTATRAYSMMFMSNIMADSKLADLYVELDTNGCSVYDMSCIMDLFFRGYRDACTALEQAGYTRQMAPEKIEFEDITSERLLTGHDPLIKRGIKLLEEGIDRRRETRRKQRKTESF